MSLVGFKSTNHPQQTTARGARDDVDDRATRWDEFLPIAERFGGFTLDVAAADHNAKCGDYYTRDHDGLLQPWSGRVWCNPPYSDLNSWVAKAWEELPNCEVIVMLVPANRTEQKWWQEHVETPRRSLAPMFTVEFLPGRMRFDRPNAVIGPKGDRPPFGCALLIWQKQEAQPCPPRVDGKAHCPDCSGIPTDGGLL
jgi:phage N-6-adenine-methyltransferase